MSIQNKVLAVMAMGRPVIASPTAFEGAGRKRDESIGCEHDCAYGIIMRPAKNGNTKDHADRGRPRSFSGSVATTGNSRGLRLETAFFRAAPEFSAAGSAIRADLIGPGTFLVRIDTLQQREEAADPVIGAWLSFIDEDIRSNPARLVPFKEGELSALERLVATVSVDDDDELPEDVVF